MCVKYASGFASLLESLIYGQLHAVNAEKL